MRITATALGGKQLVLPSPARLECNAAYDIPADSLEAVFPAHALQDCGELKEISLSLAGRTVFEGVVDEQLYRKDGRGAFLTIKARGRAAVLLDNEAIPQTFYRANLLDIYNAHVRQYGFRGILYDRCPTLSTFTVPKGKSEWQAVESFCRQTLGVTPYVQEGYVVARARPLGRRYVLQNSGEGVRFSSLSVGNRRYGVITKVILKSESKLYDTPVNNPEGARLELKRKRYVAPPREWGGNLRAGADRMMRDSMVKKLVVTAVLPTLLPVAVGDRVQVLDAAAPQGELTVFEVSHKADGAGLSTVLTLVLPDYLG